MALPLPDDGGVVRCTVYKVFRTVRLKNAQGEAYLRRRVDYFNNSKSGPYQSSWFLEKINKKILG
jgi:hypothetical protein